MLGQPNSHIRRSPQTRPSFAGLRRYNRRQLSLDVVVQDSEGWEIPLESFDISPTGIFVRSDFLFDVGEVHTLIFQVEGRGMFRVNARVARVEAPDEDDTFAATDVRPGMGYEFVETKEDTWEQLCAVAAGV
ncbi:MAG: PilZ domain-containing protein [Persicimonas sp.]